MTHMNILDIAASVGSGEKRGYYGQTHNDLYCSPCSSGMKYEEACLTAGIMTGTKHMSASLRSDGDRGRRVIGFTGLGDRNGPD